MPLILKFIRRDPRELLEGCFAISAPPEGWIDIQILKVDASSTGEGREIMEKERITDLFSIHNEKECLGPLFFKQPLSAVE